MVYLVMGYFAVGSGYLSSRGELLIGRNEIGALHEAVLLGVLDPGGVPVGLLPAHQGIPSIFLEEEGQSNGEHQKGGQDVVELIHQILVVPVAANAVG